MLNWQSRQAHYSDERSNESQLLFNNSENVQTYFAKQP
jgi:hypothetical protein